VECVYFTQHEISRLTKSHDLHELVDEVVQRHLALGGLSNDELVSRVNRGMFKLLDGHPQPFDAADTMQLFSGVVATMIKDLSSPWLRRCRAPADAVLQQVHPWPESLRFNNDFVLLAFGEINREKQEVSEAEIVSAREALLKVHNPVGKLMVHNVGSFDAVRRAFHISQLRTDVALVLIACRLFQDRENRLPRGLSELVDAGLLDGIPVDPFSGQPIRYDVTRQLVWSFGIDEEDNEGDWDFAADTPDGKDLVWRVVAQ
jgi:hypothetical protein